MTRTEERIGRLEKSVSQINDRLDSLALILKELRKPKPLWAPWVAISVLVVILIMAA